MVVGATVVLVVVGHARVWLTLVVGSAVGREHVVHLCEFSLQAALAAF